MTTRFKIAVVEDDSDLRDAIVGALTQEGHYAFGTDCAEAVIENKSAFDVDIFILDLNLPGETGLSLASRLRAIQPNVGIIMMTARTRSADRRAGYECGADIYLTKPVSLEEITAAIMALSRRIKPEMSEAPRYEFDTKAQTLRGPKGVVILSLSEAAMLVSLARAPEQKLESWQVSELLQKSDAFPRRNTVNVAIFRLNEKILQISGHNRSIRGIRNWGYKLCLKIRLS